MSKVWLVDLEEVETRYTAQWKTHVPKLLQKAGHDVQIISGPTDIPTATTPGAFLNFGGTNIYKANQVEQMGRLFCNGSVHAGDHFVFTDAWHPGIINLKYMSELLNIPVTTHGFWHAGSYDPQDFLGRLVGNKPWVRHAEKSYFWAFDHNYFATEFHVKLFIDELLMDGYKEENPWYEEDYAERYDSGKMIKTGWPMEYMDSVLTPYKNMTKRDLIVFPHRIAPEKQVEIFRDLKEQLPQYEFVVCQDQELTKNEYHNLLGEAKMVFSCSLQETLGIGCYEGALVDAIPMVPNRLSYEEMYDPQFKYPGMWTIDWNHYLGNRTVLRDHIVKTIGNYESLLPKLKTQTQNLTNNFFSANEFLKRL
jgi:glycosyltransferase involved in cell wall biosynthesis